MTCVVVNAISVKEGGSLVVLRELISGICEIRPEWNVHVACSASAAATLCESPRLSVHRYPVAERSFWRTRLWYETGLRSLVKSVSADVLFSQTNYLPTLPAGCRTLLLEQHAGHFSDDFHRLMCASLPLSGRLAWQIKSNWVEQSVRRADAVTVQTQALAEAIIRQCGVHRGRVVVVRHGPGQMTSPDSDRPMPQPGQPFVIGYTTKFGVQKNFLVLLKAVAELKRRGHLVQLVLTLDPGRPENRGVLRQAEILRIENDVRNCGELDSGELTKIYRSLHAFAFPSLCESFGFPLVEAMSFGLPVAVADTDSNREMAGESAILFPSADHVALADRLEELIRNGDWYQERCRASRHRHSDFSWVTAVHQTVNLIERVIAGQPPGIPTKC